MHLLTYLKKQLILKAIDHKRKKQGFDVEAMELHQLPEQADSLLNNSYFFGGNDKAGNSLIMRLGERNGLRELFVLYNTPEGFYTIDKQEFTPNDCPLKVSCVSPGEVWNLNFDGYLINNANQQRLPAQFYLTFSARRPIFDFMYHADCSGMAMAFAREKWNRQFFKKAFSNDTGISKKKGAVQQNDQHHYEQPGTLNGTLSLNGHTVVINLPGERDHSFGKRDWNYMCNHIWLMANTAQGETLNVSIVNYPYVKCLCAGYTDLDGDRLYSLKDYRLISYAHNQGLGPDTIELECTYTNGKTYHLTATREQNLLTPFAGGKFYFQEGIGNFTINGIAARGSIEYGFNQDESCWGDYQKQDN